MSLAVHPSLSYASPGLPSTRIPRPDSGSQLDTAAALQMAERVLSRHAQINTSFQASEPSAYWPNPRAQSAGVPGLVDILQRDSAVQRGSQGFEALDVQGGSSFRRLSAGQDSHAIPRPPSRAASRRTSVQSTRGQSLSPYPQPDHPGSSIPFPAPEVERASGRPWGSRQRRRTGSMSSALDSYGACQDSASVMAPASTDVYQLDDESNGRIALQQGLMGSTYAPSTRAVSGQSATMNMFRGSRMGDPGSGDLAVMACGRPSRRDSDKCVPAIQKPLGATAYPGGFREDSAREAHASILAPGWSLVPSDTEGTVLHSSGPQPKSRPPVGVSTKCPTPAARPPGHEEVVQGPKATLRKLPSRHEGRLTAAALAGLGGNEEEVDPRDRTTMWVRDVEAAMLGTTSSLSQADPPKHDRQAVALDEWRAKRRVDDTKSKRQGGVLSIFFCFGV